MGRLVEDVILAYRLGLISARAKTMMFFEVALELVAPEIKADRDSLEAEYGLEGFNRWAKKYGIAEHAFAVEVGDRSWTITGRTDLPTPSSSPRTFTFRARARDEDVATYLHQLDDAFEAWREEVFEEERGLREAQLKLIKDWQQMYYAEWFVLHRLKGLSHEQIAKLYTACGEEDDEEVGSLRRHHDSLPEGVRGKSLPMCVDADLVKKGVKRFADVAPGIVFMRQRGGRPKTRDKG